ncbi:MAG TPA: TonB-dependent receptor [Flavisolibacter sp.]
MRYLLLLMLAICTLFCDAQQVTGSVTNENGAPVAGATVTLLKSKDSSVAKISVSGPDGSYSFPTMPEGNYLIVVTHTGYKAVHSSRFSLGDVNIHVPAMTLTRLTGMMTAVNVTAQKPLVEVRADKMIVNVEGTINATGLNALELLRRSPGVLIDKDDNISMSAKTGVQVHIDGRSTHLSGQELSAYLRSLQSSQVESIELITNPSAKYDAAGNAGIINIRLVKNKALGANGSVNAGWNIGITPKYNGGMSFNYRSKRINLFGTYAYNYAPVEQHLDFRRTTALSGTPDTLFDQQGTISDVRQAHNIKAGVDFFVNKRNTFGVLVNAILADPVSDSYSRTLISDMSTNVVDRILVADNSNTMKRHNANFNLNYGYSGTSGELLTLNADRGSYDLHSNQFQRNYYYDPSGQVLQSSVIYHMLSPAQINIHSVKADYERALGKGRLSFGAKTAWVTTDNDFRRYDVLAGGEQLDHDRSNRFLYQEDIAAAYASFSRQYKSFMMQAGVRMEHTSAEGVSESVKFDGAGFSTAVTSFKRSYTDFFPSAAVTFNKNKEKQWSLTYSRRIDRPAYKDLNPFEFALDEYSFMKGNVNLRPQYTNSISLAHTYKYKLNLSLNYSHVNNMFADIFDTASKSKAFVSKRNLATQDIFAFNMSYPYQYKAFSVFTNVSANFSMYEANFGEGRRVDLEAFGLTIFSQASLKFAKTLTAEVTAFFNAPTVYQGTFRAKAVYNADAGISKRCLDGKVTLKASVSDIFYTQRFSATSDFAGQTMKFNYRQESRQFKLALAYKFGRSTIKAARQRTVGAEEELKRVQQGGGVLGN